MGYNPKFNSKERQRIAAHKVAEARKNPYLVKGMPRTVLYLTIEQAAKRLDLIPQFVQQPLESEPS